MTCYSISDVIFSSTTWHHSGFRKRGRELEFHVGQVISSVAMAMHILTEIGCVTRWNGMNMELADA